MKKLKVGQLVTAKITRANSASFVTVKGTIKKITMSNFGRQDIEIENAIVSGTFMVSDKNVKVDNKQVHVSE